MSMSSIGNAVKAMAIFMIIEFILLAFSLFLMGAFTDAPLKLISDLATSSGTTVMDIAIGIFIIGTFFNLIIMFVIAAIRH